jgi:RimJ/RimL family protein N-acetyltransferase
MHDHVLRSLAEQHQGELLASARQHRLAKMARRAPDPLGAAGSILAEPTLLTVRPITPHDTDRLTRLFGRLSARSVRLRFFAPLRTLSEEHLVRLVDVDHKRDEALVAVSNDEIIAVARYVGRGASPEAELAVTVEDTWQRRRIGTRLTQRLSTIASARGYDAFVASILPENRAALRLARTLSGQTSVRWNDGAYEALIPLSTA